VKPQSAETLERTALFRLHRELGARMVPFAGFEMPVRYPAGILAEHLHTRAHASLFDVSHMGQVAIRGAGAVAALERLVPADLAALAPGRVRYTMLTTATGGILDDLMVTNVGKYLFLVINASRRAEDLAHLGAHLDGGSLDALDDRALLALQGPAAASVLAGLAPGAEHMKFMSAAPFTIDGSRLAIARAGYTGEDGFEISLPSVDAERIARLLLDHEEVAPAGLGARDSLRLEAGLCLYGNDIDTTTTPVEAGLGWTIGKRRRIEGGFPGDEIILAQLKDGAPRRLVGIKPHGRAPARADAEILDPKGAVIGTVTSGTFGPSAGGPVAMGYVEAGNRAAGTELALVVRGTPRPAQIVGLPFVPHRYFKAECD
jgi:aminomethyltransferase